MDSAILVPESQNLSKEWADRCAYWHRQSDQIPTKRKRRDREIRGLILTGHGISISVHRGTLLIQGGNTHYPATKETYRFFKGDLALPPRLVLIDGSGSISLDAMDWLAAQRVDLIRLNWDGRILSVGSASGYSADRRKVSWQMATRADRAKRLAFASALIADKAKATLFNLRELLPPSQSREKAIETSRNAITELKSNPPTTVSKLLAIEGWVAAGYFFAWRALPIKWAAINRYPIPDDWKRFFSRSSLKQDMRVGNRHATHPVNALLNYAYTVLEAHTRIKAIADGYDPTIGILHDDEVRERHAFVFDTMEPSRPIADRAVLNLISKETFTGGDFILQKDGVCRLNPELARRLANEVTRLIQSH